MRAAVMRDWKLVVDTIPDPDPSPGNVLVKTLACGICGSDLHALKFAEEFVASSRETGSPFVMDLSRDLVLVYDDVDLPFGRLRVRPGGSSGGHRGVSDVIECLAREDFARLRFGVGRSEVETVDHVLRGFTSDEKGQLARHLDRAVDALETRLGEGVERAMTLFTAPLEE